MVDVISPQDIAIYYDVETTYGDGAYDGSPCTGYNPSWKWIGIIQDAMQEYTKNKLECRGIGSVDANSFNDGLESPSVTLKWIIQKYKSGTFDPATLLAYIKTFPTGITLAWEATYGSSPSYVTYWYKGMQMDSLDIEFNIDSFIIATAKFVGHDVVDDTSLIAADSRESNPLDVANGYCTPLTGFDTEVFYNAAGGGDTAITNVKSVKLSIKNNIQRIPAIQTSNAQYLKYIRKSKRELTFEIVAYMEDKTQYADLLDATNLDIRVDLHKTDNRPYVDLTGCEIDAGNISTRINELPCLVTLPGKATGITIA